MNRLMAKFTITIETRKKVKLYLQNTINQGKKNYQPRMKYPAKLLFKNDEIKTLLDKTKTEFITYSDRCSLKSNI